MDVSRELVSGAALDLASGEGADAIWLASQGWDVTAVDFAPAALERTLAAAREAGVAERITCISADLTRWRPDSVFDLVTISFFHAPTHLREDAHRMAWAATRGTLLVVGHDPRNHHEGHDGPSDPAKLYSPIDVLASLGLNPGAPDVVAADTWLRHQDDPERIAFDSVVILRRATDKPYERPAGSSATSGK